jgi:hypothetical protein
MRVLRRAIGESSEVRPFRHIDSPKGRPHTSPRRGKVGAVILVADHPPRLHPNVGWADPVLPHDGGDGDRPPRAAGSPPPRPSRLLTSVHEPATLSAPQPVGTRWQVEEIHPPGAAWAAEPPALTPRRQGGGEDWYRVRVAPYAAPHRPGMGHEDTKWVRGELPRQGGLTDALVAGSNSDESVPPLKGAGVPGATRSLDRQVWHFFDSGGVAFCCLLLRPPGARNIPKGVSLFAPRTVSERSRILAYPSGDRSPIVASEGVEIIARNVSEM